MTFDDKPEVRPDRSDATRAAPTTAPTPGDATPEATPAPAVMPASEATPAWEPTPEATPVPEARPEPEATPLPEALPVIASSAGALPEVVGDGGVLVSPDDAEEWTRVMCQLLHDPARRDDLRARATHRAAHARFSRARAGADLADAYRAAAGPQR